VGSGLLGASSSGENKGMLGGGIGRKEESEEKRERGGGTRMGTDGGKMSRKKELGHQ